MINDIKKILNENGPLESGKLRELLKEKNNGSISGIKSWLSRNKDVLKSNNINISRVVLKHNSHIYYLNEQLFELVKLLKDEYENLPVGRLLKALYDSKFLFSTEVYKIIGLPIKYPIKGHKYATNCIKELIDNNIIKVVNNRLYNEYICFSKDLSEIPELGFEINDLKRRFNNIYIQNKLLKDFVYKLKLQNILGWNSVNVYNLNGGSPIDNDYNFYDHFVDAFGFSYVSGIKPNKPVIINSLIYRRFNEYDLSALKTMMNNIKTINKIDFISILIYGKPMPHNIHKELKKMGIILVSVNEILNSDSLINLLESNKNKNLDEQLKDAEKTIEKLNGNSNNLRGFLFNYAIALLFQQIGYETSMNKIYNSKKRFDPDLPERECDVIAMKDDIAIIVELKAYDTNNHVKLGENEDENDSVKKFFESTIRSAKAEFNKTKPEVSIFPIFITTSLFTGDAKKYMDMKDNSKKIVKIKKELGTKFPNTVYYDRNKLLSLTQQRFKSIKKLIKNHF